MREIGKLLTLFFFVLIGLSCSDNESSEYNNSEEQTVQNKEDTNHLAIDFRFIKYVNLNKDFIESLDYSSLDIDLIEDLTNKDNLTNEELEILARAIRY